MAYDFADASMDMHADGGAWADFGETSAHDHHVRDVQWNKISDNFTNAGYREGITAGKEAALQEGFDDGFATVGVPLGHELGLLRGRASALVSFLRSKHAPITNASVLTEAQDINSALSEIRFSDIAPPDLEAEAHAREHLEANGVVNEDAQISDESLRDKADMETLEDMLGTLSAGNTDGLKKQRPSVHDVQRLKERLDALWSTIASPNPSS